MRRAIGTPISPDCRVVDEGGSASAEAAAGMVAAERKVSPDAALHMIPRKSPPSSPAPICVVFGT